MADDAKSRRGRQSDSEQFAAMVGAKEKRKIRGRATRRRNPWFWAGMFGLVGWSVAVPAALATWLGYKLDRDWMPDSGISWTLTCMVLGMAAGCLNAWFWMKRESARSEE